MKATMPLAVVSAKVLLVGCAPAAFSQPCPRVTEFPPAL
jgi:hypothetical protein